jgi:hypothetical protein
LFHRRSNASYIEEAQPIQDNISFDDSPFCDDSPFRSASPVRYDSNSNTSCTGDKSNKKGSKKQKKLQKRHDEKEDTPQCGCISMHHSEACLKSSVPGGCELKLVNKKLFNVIKYGGPSVPKKIRRRPKCINDSGDSY